MKTWKIAALVACILTIGLAANAQSYSSAVGLRLGYPLSVSYKQFLNENGAIEAFGGFRSWSGYSWVNLGAMYEHHQPIPNVDGLNWYFGGGASVFFWNYKDVFLEDEASVSFGILGTIGLDYKFEEVPINVSVDWVPAFFVNGYDNGFSADYGAVSVRYVLK